MIVPRAGFLAQWSALLDRRMALISEMDGLMAHGDLRGFDLNLLVTLDALLQERSVTSAARRLGISQPAASQALARLRRHFDDELLARQGGSYALTPKASGLLDELAELLDRAKLVVEGESDFNPLSSDREFRLMCSDYAAVVIGSELSNRQIGRASCRERV